MNLCYCNRYTLHPFIFAPFLFPAFFSCARDDFFTVFTSVMAFYNFKRFLQFCSHYAHLYSNSKGLIQCVTSLLSLIDVTI